MKPFTSPAARPARILALLALLTLPGLLSACSAAGLANTAASAIGATGISDMKDPLPIVVTNGAASDMDVAWHCPEIGERVGGYIGRVPAGGEETFDLPRGQMCLSPSFFAAATSGGDVRRFPRVVRTHLTVGVVRMQIGDGPERDRITSASRQGPAGVGGS